LLDHTGACCDRRGIAYSQTSGEILGTLAFDEQGLERLDDVSDVGRLLDRPDPGAARPA